MKARITIFRDDGTPILEHVGDALDMFGWMADIHAGIVSEDNRVLFIGFEYTPKVIDIDTLESYDKRVMQY